MPGGYITTMTEQKLEHHWGLPKSAYRDPVIFALLSFAIPGFVAMLLVAIGALGVGWLPLNSVVTDLTVVDTMRTTTAGLWLSRLMVFVGVALLLQTWLVLGSDLMGGLRMGRGVQATILAAWSAPLLFAPPLFSRDVYAYLAQGRLLAEGIDPYQNGVSSLPGWFIEGVDPMWGETPSPYGPLFLMISRSVAEFADERVFLAAVIFRLLAVAGVIGMLYLVPILAKAHGIDPAKAVWLAVLNPLVIMHFVAGGHNDAIMVALLLAAFAFAVRRQSAAAAAMVALATSVKPIALLALPFIGIARTPHAWTWRQRITDWVFVSLVAGAVFLVTVVIAGVGFGWVSALGTPGVVKTWLSPMTAIGMVVGGAFQLLDLAATNDVAVNIFRSIGLVISLGIVTYLSLRPNGRSATRGAALAFLAVVALGPVVQPWYLLWVLPLLVVTGLTGWQFRAVIVLTAALTIHGMVDGSATADTLLDLGSGLAILVAIALVAVILLASPRERRLVLPTSGEGLTPTTSEQRQRAAAATVSAQDYLPRPASP